MKLEIRKSIIFLLLVTIVVGSVTTVSASSNYTITVENTKVTSVKGSENKIKELSKRGIVEGYEDGELKLERDISRAEFVKILVYAANEKENSLNLSDINSKYIDLDKDHWANGVINFGTNAISKVNNQVILQGYLDESFKPDNNITYEELSKMLVVLIKNDLSDELLNEANKSWPNTWIKWAEEYKLYEDVKNFEIGSKATREDAFVMLYNALPKVEENKEVVKSTKRKKKTSNEVVEEKETTKPEEPKEPEVPEEEKIKLRIVTNACKSLLTLDGNQTYFPIEEDYDNGGFKLDYEYFNERYKTYSLKEDIQENIYYMIEEYSELLEEIGKLENLSTNEIEAFFKDPDNLWRLSPLTYKFLPDGEFKEAFEEYKESNNKEKFDDLLNDLNDINEDKDMTKEEKNEYILQEFKYLEFDEYDLKMLREYFKDKNIDDYEKYILNQEENILNEVKLNNLLKNINVKEIVVKNVYENNKKIENPLKEDENKLHEIETKAFMTYYLSEIKNVEGLTEEKFNAILDEGFIELSKKFEDEKDIKTIEDLKIELENLIKNKSVEDSIKEITNLNIKYEKEYVEFMKENNFLNPDRILDNKFSLDIIIIDENGEEINLSFKLIFEYSCLN